MVWVVCGGLRYFDGPGAVISRFGFEGGILVLIVPAPDHCLLVASRTWEYTSLVYFPGPYVRI